MRTSDTPTMETRAAITDYAVSLRAMLAVGSDWPAELRDPMSDIARWALAYASLPTDATSERVAAAHALLRAWVATGSGVPPAAYLALDRAYEVAVWVDRATEPAPADPFAAIERTLAAEAGVTVEAYRRQEDEHAAGWRTRMSLMVEGIHTDRPTMPGAAMLSVAQLRHLSREFADMADHKAAGSHPAESGRVAAEDDVCGPMSTGQAVA